MASRNPFGMQAPSLADLILAAMSTGTGVGSEPDFYATHDRSIPHQLPGLQVPGQRTPYNPASHPAHRTPVPYSPQRRQRY